MALTIKVVENKPRVFVVTLAGSLDSKILTLDVAGLTFISSMGIRVVFKAQKDLARAGGYLCLARIPAPIQKALEIVEALPSMQIFASIQEMDAYLAKMQGL